MYGGDAAVPLRWFTVKGEAGYFTSSNPRADDYLQYVVQGERQVGEWRFAAGYVGEAVTVDRGGFIFAPDRGMARAFLAHASYSIDINRGLTLEGALRRNGDGFWLKAEYTQAIGRSLRATASFTVIRGSPQDFFGQYSNNSFGALSRRYSM